MKDKNIWILVLISFIPLIWIGSSTQLWHTHDGLVHIPRLAAFYTALADGHFPPRFAGYLNFGYGLPLFIFIYHLPYYIGSLFIALGVSLSNAFRYAIVLSYILSAASMYFFARAFFKDRRIAFWVTMFYQFAPFRFVDLHMRGSFGEVYTYVFLPLVLWGITRIIEKQTIHRVIFTAVSVGLLIASHNSISLAYFGVAVLFLLFFAMRIKQYIYGIVSLVLGLLLSAWYWLPALIEHKYTYGNLLMKSVYKSHFVPWYLYIIPNFTNPESLRFEGIVPQFGIFHIAAIIGAVYLLYRGNKKWQRLMVFSIVMMCGAIFLMQPIAAPLWKRIPLLQQFQFPWRLLSILVVATSFLSVSLITNPLLVAHKKMQTIFLCLLVISSAYFWFPQEGYNTIDEAYYWNFPLNTTYYGETDVIWGDGPASSYPLQLAEVIGGTATISAITRKSHTHEFDIISSGSARIVSHVQYFPGWRVYVDSAKVPIEFQDQNWRGELTYEVPDGNHRVFAEFGRSPVRLVSELLSAVTFVGLLGAWLYLKVVRS